MTYSVLIADWLAASETNKRVAYNLLTTQLPPGAGFGRGLLPMNVMSNWLAFTLLGIGMLRSAIYPKWMGGYGSVVGVIGVSIGVQMLFIGREPIFNLSPIFGFFTILRVYLCGLWVARKAW